MKQIIKLLTVTSAAVTTLAPSLVLTACSRGQSLYDQMAEETVEEFKNLAVIPHASDAFLSEVPYELGNCWEISCYLKERISSILGKNIFQDKYGNLVFDIPATSSDWDNAPKIALQAHMDMVFAYDKSDIEFKPDPRIWKVSLVDEEVDGKRIIHSDKYRTSIGADDGIGVAMILTLLKRQDIKHGPLRCIITNCEENGAQGGSLLVNETYPNVMKDVSYVINLDGEDLGEIYVASSGAVGSYYYINSNPSKEKDTFVPTAATNLFTINVSGFPGGHSGVAIKNRIDNALKFTNCMLELLNIDEHPIRLHSISTPECTVYNAIPTSCEVTICSDEWKTSTLQEVQTIINAAFEAAKTERKTIDWPEGDQRKGYDTKFDSAQYDKVTCTVTQAKPKYAVALTEDDTAKIIKLQGDEELEYGIKHWPTDEEMAALTGTQTSANIGPAEGKMSSNFTFEYKLSTYSRSSDVNEVNSYFKMNEQAALECGATWKYDAKFDPWHVDSNKKLLELAQKGWSEAGVETQPVRTHGGLECSFWHEAMEFDESKIGKTAIVAFGPQLHDVHKPVEILEVDSIKPCLQAIVYILQHSYDLTVN